MRNLQKKKLQPAYLFPNVFHLVFSITKKLTNIIQENFLGVASYISYVKKG